mmetsp:Transcript_14093/g.41440  ORF Transcript_14093/g.41440 Transcript_14093/m.41440 type:complete len:275 (-) Transcript_14093:335-1159(-)
MEVEGKRTVHRQETLGSFWARSCRSMSDSTSVLGSRSLPKHRCLLGVGSRPSRTSFSSACPPWLAGAMLHCQPSSSSSLQITCCAMRSRYPREARSRSRRSTKLPRASPCSPCLGALREWSHRGCVRRPLFFLSGSGVIWRQWGYSEAGDNKVQWAAAGSSAPLLRAAALFAAVLSPRDQPATPTLSLHVLCISCCVLNGNVFLVSCAGRIWPTLSSWSCARSDRASGKGIALSFLSGAFGLADDGLRALGETPTSNSGCLFCTHRCCRCLSGR